MPTKTFATCPAKNGAIAVSKLGRPRVSRNEIVYSAMNSVKQPDCGNLSVAELAAGVGVSERTLRDAFQECFGMGPTRYLKLWRLIQVRRVFQNIDSSESNVTKIATRCGLWELGRFAKDYRLLFGELSSETLRSRRKVRPRVPAELLRVRPERCPYSP